MVSVLDTAKDARLLVLEDALRRLNELVGNRKLKLHVDYSKLGSALQQAGSLIYEIKYSYVPAPKVAELEATQKIVNGIAEFRRILEEAIQSSGYKPSTLNESLSLTEAFYSFRIVERLLNKLQDFDDEPAYAVDILAVELSQVQTVPDSKNLSECRCTDGSRIWKIVTNIQDLKTGIKLACAILPPVEMMGIVSEAMFLGGEPLPEETELGFMKTPPSSALDQARAQVLQITKRMT
jgi:predicted RNA-binding protein with EMAP domain